MKTVTIICRDPGFRRLGVAHPASHTYEGDRWTRNQLATLKADPMFQVVEQDAEGAAIPRTAIADVGGSPASVGIDLARGPDRQEYFRRGGPGEPEFVPVELPRRDLPHPFAALGVALPSAVAPGADASDFVQDNGAGPAVNDLGAKSGGVGEAAAAATAEGLRPPVFDDARLQAIRAALQDFGPTDDPGSRANQRKLRQALGFEPTVEEIAAARVEAVAPEATVKT